MSTRLAQTGRRRGATKGPAPLSLCRKQAEEPLNGKVYVKALSTVLGKGLGLDNIDSFVLHPLSGRTYKADLCGITKNNDNRITGYQEGWVHLYLDS